MLIKITNLEELFVVLSLPKYKEGFCTKMLLKCSPILSNDNIDEFLKFLKTRAVKAQDYETGAMLRDFQRNEYTLNELLLFLREEYKKSL